MGGLRKPRIDPSSLVLILLCVGWTSQTLFFGKTLEQAGAITRYRLWEGDFWRIPASIFLHGPWWHLALNCLAILFIGPIVALGVGAAVYLATVVFSALAGLSASLLFHEKTIPLVGISGGILGLIGLILAVEWRNAQGRWMAFFRRRNVVVILILIVINAILAVTFELRGGEVKLDHAAHLAGMGFGLIGGLALFGKERAHVGRGLAAAALLALLPLAIAAWPNWQKSDAKGLVDRARWAQTKGDEAKAHRLYEFALELDPGNTIAGCRLAAMDDDPKRLDGLREAVGNHEKRPAILVRLLLAERRFQSDRETATRLTREASEIRLKEDEEKLQDGVRWLRFAKAAQQAERFDLAQLAFETAAKDLPPHEKWRGAVPALPAIVRSVRRPGSTKSERLERALRAAQLARTAVGSLTDKVPPEDQGEFRKILVSGLLELDKLARLINQPVLFDELATAWHEYAENTLEIGAGRPEAFLRAAVQRWQAEGVTDRVKKAFQTAAEEAREEKNAAVEKEALAWFEARGLPAPNLADSKGGG